MRGGGNLCLRLDKCFDRVKSGYSVRRYFGKLCSGFTLAEVLITLGIVGVVAAMTLPVITQKVEKAVLKSQIKKSYSTLSQVQQKVMFEWGDALSISNGFGYKDFNDAVLANLKIIKKCEKNALAQGCIPKYTGLNISQCSGFNETNVYNNQPAYILSDGEIIIPYNGDWQSLWLIDVNGLKGPNKAGYDLFDVTLASNKALNFRGKGCLNQGNPPPVQGGLDSYKDIDNW